MFAQRNNPYCDLLQISIANIGKKILFYVFFLKKFHTFEKLKNLNKKHMP